MDTVITACDFDDYRARVRAFTRQELRALETEVDTSGKVPEHVVARMRELGLFAVSIPREYGGLGWTLEQQVLLALEYTQTLAVFRSRMSTTTGLASQMILELGTEKQRRQYLPSMASGECTGAAAITEPEAGSDAGATQTTATPRGDAYIINGQKRFITNASVADVILVLARTEENTAGHKGTTMFLVPNPYPGLRVIEPPADEMFAWRGSPTCQIHFEDCEVPPAARVGQEGAGLHTAFRGFNHARLTIAASSVGMSIRMLEEAAAHAVRRRQFGQPIGEFGAIETMLADMQVKVSAAQALILETARRWDKEGHVPAVAVATAKYFCSTIACDVASQAMQILGGDGIVGGHIVSRLFRDVRVATVAEGSTQILASHIARDVKRSVRALD